MNAAVIIGYFAASLTTLSFIPQLLKIVKTRDAKSISLPMYFLTNAGTCLWLIYGVMTKNLPIILCDSLALVFAGIILFYKLKFDGPKLKGTLS